MGGGAAAMGGAAAAVAAEFSYPRVRAASRWSAAAVSSLTQVPFL